jgi:hypothetical protein
VPFFSFYIVNIVIIPLFLWKGLTFAHVYIIIVA